MPKPNENGVYEAEIIEENARHGRAHACVKISKCEDGQYRFALDMAYSYGGFCGPITDRGAGFPSPAAATEAGTRELLARLPVASRGDPESVHEELRQLKSLIEQRFRQPSLF